jgi:hypothetical protein
VIAQASPEQIGVVAAGALFVGGVLRDLLVRHFGAGGGSKPASPAPDDRERLQRIEQCLGEVRDRVVRLDEAHAGRTPDGTPLHWCQIRHVERDLAQLHSLVAQLLEPQRQSNGLLSKLARRIREALGRRGV